jgi:DNA-binding NarL/FixJ family response regulator
MPRMNGLHAARILHSVDADVPIILFTLHADTISAIEASDAGIALVVSKMRGISVLAEQVGSLLRYA